MRVFLPLHDYLERGEYLAPDRVGLVALRIGAVRDRSRGTGRGALQRLVEEDERIPDIGYYPERVHVLDKRALDIQRREEVKDRPPRPFPGRAAPAVHETLLVCR